MAKSPRREFLGIAGALAATASFFSVLSGARTAQAQDASKATGLWAVRGVFVESCSCEAMCPCVVGGPPTAGTCSVLQGWHVDSGRYAEVALDGLNVVVVIFAPEHMAKGNWKHAMYLDQRASSSQRDALEAIFSGKAGGYLAGRTKLFGEMLPPKSAAIDIQADGRRRKLTVSGLAEMEIVAVNGRDGREFTVENTPGGSIPNHPLVVARSTRLNYRDHGMTWELSGKNGFYSPFSYASS